MSTGTSSAWSSRRAGAIALAISAVYVLALANPVHRHAVGVFSDFYRWYAPDADRIALGAFPQNTYNPPGYPLLLALVSPLTDNRFAAGKWTSLLAAGLAGILAFYLHRRLFGAAAALLAVPIMLSSPTFTTYAIAAMTDVPFVCVCLGALIAITDEGPRRKRAAGLAGALCGAAYLLRYNGVFLLVPGLAGVISGGGSKTERVQRAGIYLGCFLLTVAPWLGLNHAQHGSALYSTNYRDVAREHIPHVDAGTISSLADVFVADPLAFAGSYVQHLGPTLINSFGASLALFPVGPLAALGIVVSLARYRQRAVLIVLAGALAFFLLMSLTHWERRYFLVLLACYSGFAAFAIIRIAGAIGRAVGRPVIGSVVVATFALLIVIPSVARSWRAVRTTLARQPIELLAAARYLAGVAPSGATVMSVRAQIAYLSRHPWHELPDARSVEELGRMLDERPPDYLVYDRWGRFRKGLTALATPESHPSWLRPIYHDGSVVIYAVERR
jgi:4-amino-4-deoxy-L-arabinose transferase-like glycosyltransferase